MKPGHWARGKPRNVHLPLGCPSKACISAQRQIVNCSEQIAIDALLNLPRGNNNTVDSSTSDSDSKSSSGKSTDTVSTDGVVDEIQNAKPTPDSNTGNAVTGNNTEVDPAQAEELGNADTDDENMPLSEVQKTLQLGKTYFKTKLYELFKYKRKRTFKCLKCGHIKKSQRKINKHIRSSHGLLSCDNCGKMCNTLSALRKHNYEHTEKAGKHPCDNCGKSFTFASMLKSHRKVHLTVLEHHCLHCDKSFKNKGELSKHQSVHSGKKWFCQQAGCKYECIDPRNLRAYMHSHNAAGRYKCAICGKGFKVYQQMKRHRDVDCGNTGANQ